MSNKEAFSSVKLPMFTGKVADFPMWNVKFQAWAACKGYKSVMMGKEKIPIPKSTEDLVPTKDAEKIRIRELNARGMAEFFLCISDTEAGRVAFQTLKNTISSEYEDGNLHFGYKGLVDKYKPKTAPTEMSFFRKVL